MVLGGGQGAGVMHGNAADPVHRRMGVWVRMSAEAPFARVMEVKSCFSSSHLIHLSHKYLYNEEDRPKS